MNKVRACLWFNGEAEEAVELYKSVFKNVSVTDIMRWGEGGWGTPGAVLAISFEIEGQEFLALNAGPENKFNDAVSFIINCESQEEVDTYWSKLLETGGKEIACGWINDKFGLAWQIVPTRLMELMHDSDPEKAQRVMQAMMKMIKIDLPAIEAAYRGE